METQEHFEKSKRFINPERISVLLATIVIIVTLAVILCNSFSGSRISGNVPAAAEKHYPTPELKAL